MFLIKKRIRVDEKWNHYFILLLFALHAPPLLLVNPEVWFQLGEQLLLVLYKELDRLQSHRPAERGG